MKDYDFREITPILDPGDFQQVIENPVWLNLSPNFPTPSALPPQFLTEKHIDQIMDALSPGSPLTKLDLTDLNLKPELNLKDLGKLSFFNYGESKWCYLLTTEDQRKMAIHVGGANARFTIPSNNRIHIVATGLGKHLLSYSDLRTYLCLPVNIKTNDYEGPISMMFQEWGGEETLVDPKDKRIKRGLERVTDYLIKRGYLVNSYTKWELSHPRHFLINSGSEEPVVIDIPFESTSLQGL